MYSEEEDLCFRMRGMGYKVYYFPMAKIIHFEGASSKGEEIKSMKLFWKSKMLYFKRYSSPLRIKIFKICFTLLLELKMLFRIIPRNDYYRRLLENLKEL